MNKNIEYPMNLQSDLTRGELLLLIAAHSNNTFRNFNLHGARLHGDYSNINFRNFNFTNTDLRGANFSGCAFGVGNSETVFAGANVSGAIFDDSARQLLQSAINVNEVQFVIRDVFGERVINDPSVSLK